MKHFGILTLFLFYSWIVLPQSALNNEKHVLDSLHAIILNTNSHDTSIAATYVKLSEILAVSNLDTVSYLCNKAKQIVEKNLARKLDPKTKRSFLLILATSLNNIGYVYKQQNNLNKALEFYNKSLKTREEIGDKPGIANSLNNIGSLYDNLGKIEKALEHYDRSLKIQEAIGDKKNAAISLINIGSLYYYQGDTIKSLEFLYQGVKILEKNGNKYFLSVCQNNIGNILNSQKKPTKALSFLDKSLNIRKSIEDNQGVATCLNNIALSYSILAEQMSNKSRKDSLKRVELSYYRKSLKILEKIEDKKNIASSLLNIGRMELKSGNIAQAKKNALRSFAISKDIGFPVNIKQSAKLLSMVYEKEGKGIASLEMYKLFITMRDSVSNNKTQKATIKQNMQYNFDKKETLAKIEHEKELTRTKVEKNKQRIIIWGVSIGLLLILIFSFVIVKRLRISNAQKLIIEQKNAENELLLGEIHHRVKNNLQVISSLLGLQERSINDKSAKAAIIEGKERVKSMGLIHKLLYQHDNYSGVEMNDYVNKLIHGLLDSFGMDKSNIKLNLDFSKIKLDVDTAIPVGLIINELVINSLKYAYENIESPSLKVNLIETDKELILEIADNGNGKMTELNNSKSFGMKLVKSLARQVGGNIIFNDDSGLNIKINISDYKLV
ncbi:MAG: tetratricopeptide repeat protein [Flavobacteriales bacterium]|nr:tetratricopeptide repeat protein [Flavobacteriales bacterium]